MWPWRGVPIVPVATQSPAALVFADWVGRADGSLGVELGDVSSGDAVATTPNDGAGSGGTTDGSRRMPEPAASAPPTSRRAAAARSVMPRPADPSGNAPSLPASVQIDDDEVERQRFQMLLQDPAQAKFERGIVEFTHVAPPRRTSVRRRGLSAGARGPTSLRLDGVRAVIEHLSHRLDRQVQVVAQADRGTHPRRQVSDGLPVRQRVIGGRSPVLGDGSLDDLELDDVGGALAISKRLVGGDPEQPRSQGIVVTQASTMIERREQAVGDDVFGRGPVTDDR